MCVRDAGRGVFVCACVRLQSQVFCHIECTTIDPKFGLVMRSEQLADGQNRAHGLPDEVKMSSWRTLEGVSLAKKLA